MSHTQKSNSYLFFWILALFALFPLWMSYKSYEQQVSEVATLKSKLLECKYVVKNINYPCLSKVKNYVPIPSYRPLAASGLLFTVALVFSIYQTIIRILENRKKPARDFLNVMIGSKHSQDLLGEMYHISFLYRQNKSSPNASYLFGVLDECVRRVTSFYGLIPTGNPGDGPITFTKDEHIAFGHIMPDEKVWIAQVGWKRNGEILLPSMVSKDPNQYIDGDWQ